MIALLAVLGASAQAYSGERAADGRTYSAVAVAVDYWHERGVVGCPGGIEALYAASLADTDAADASARGASCRVWIAEPILAYTRADGPRWVRRLAARFECRLIVHEVGHALGIIEHTERGIMSARDQPVPAECYRWARGLYPRPFVLGRVIAKPLRSYVRR